MRNKALIAAMAALAWAAPAIAGEFPALTADGYGPVKIGMRVDQASNSEASAMRVAMASPWGQAFSALE